MFWLNKEEGRVRDPRGPQDLAPQLVSLAAPATSSSHYELSLSYMRLSRQKYYDF